MRKVIRFDDGTIAVVYKSTDIRTQLTIKQAADLQFTKQIINIPKTKEQLWIQL